MSVEMFLVGAILFALYIYFTTRNILRNNNKQNDENKSKKEVPIVDEFDSDGMGNFSRFPKEKKE